MIRRRTMFAAILIAIIMISVTCCTCCTAYAMKAETAAETTTDTTDTDTAAAAEAVNEIFERFEKTQKISIFEVANLLEINNEYVRYVTEEDGIVLLEKDIITLKEGYEVLALQNVSNVSSEELRIINEEKDAYLLLKTEKGKCLFIVRGEDHTIETGIMVLVLGLIAGVLGLGVFGVAASDERKRLKRARISTVFGILTSAVMVVWAISGLVILLMLI